LRDYAAAAQARQDAAIRQLHAAIAAAGPAASIASNAVGGSADDMECCMCLDAPEEPVASPCGHVFCEQCIRDALSQERRSDDAPDDNMILCDAPFEPSVGP
jgi:hypothetical protein